MYKLVQIAAHSKSNKQAASMTLRAMKKKKAWPLGDSIFGEKYHFVFCADVIYFVIFIIFNSLCWLLPLNARNFIILFVYFILSSFLFAY